MVKSFDHQLHELRSKNIFHFQNLEKDRQIDCLKRQLAQIQITSGQKPMQNASTVSSFLCQDNDVLFCQADL